MIEQQGPNHLTAYGLPKALGTTTRSGNRLTSKLFHAGYAKGLETEHPTKGRTRRLYKLKLESLARQHPQLTY